MRQKPYWKLYRTYRLCKNSLDMTIVKSGIANSSEWSLLIRSCPSMHNQTPSTSLKTCTNIQLSNLHMAYSFTFIAAWKLRDWEFCHHLEGPSTKQLFVCPLAEWHESPFITLTRVGMTWTILYRSKIDCQNHCSPTDILWHSISLFSIFFAFL